MCWWGMLIDARMAADNVARHRISPAIGCSSDSATWKNTFATFVDDRWGDWGALIVFVLDSVADANPYWMCRSRPRCPYCTGCTVD